MQGIIFIENVIPLGQPKRLLIDEATACEQLYIDNAEMKTFDMRQACRICNYHTALFDDMCAVLNTSNRKMVLKVAGGSQVVLSSLVVRYD